MFQRVGRLRAVGVTKLCAQPIPVQRGEGRQERGARRWLENERMVAVGAAAHHARARISHFFFFFLFKVLHFTTVRFRHLAAKLCCYNQ